MKHLRLILVAIATVFGLGANAQSWQAEEVAAGEFVLYNVGTGQYFTNGNDWNTRASITSGSESAGLSAAIKLTLELYNGKYKLRSDLGQSGWGVEWLTTNDVYVDQSRGKNATWDFILVEGAANGPIYNIKAAENHQGGTGIYLTANRDNTIVKEGTDGNSTYAQWKLLSYSKIPLLSVIARYNDIKAACKAICPDLDTTAPDAKVNAATSTAAIEEAIQDVRNALSNSLGEATIGAEGVDLTNALIENASPGTSGSLAYWINSGNPTLQANLWEYWSVAGGTTKQSIATALPAGYYTLTAVAYTRDNMTATLHAGENTMKIVGVASSVVNNRTEGSNWIAQGGGNGVNELSFKLEEPTSGLEIGLTADATTSDYWMCWRSFNLKFFGSNPFASYQARLAEAVTEAEGLEGTVPTSVYQALAAVVAENNKDYNTAEEYEAAITAIKNAISTAKALQSAYSRYNDVKAACVAVNGDLNTADADAAANAATTAEEIEAAVAAVRSALLAALPNMEVPEEGIELTNAIIDNPTVRQNTNYWTAEGTPNPSYSWAVVNYEETEFYQQKFDFYQNLTLGKGTYEFGVTGFHRAGNHSTYFYAGVDKILIPGVESSVVNTMAQAQTYFNEGNGKVALKFALEDESNDIKIGIVNNDTETDRWTIFRDFTLKYFGSQVDLSEYENRWAEAVAAANAALEDEANAKVTGDELTAINAAKADVPERTKASYIEKTDALLAATQAFIAAAPAYDAYAAEKAIAEMIGVTPGEEPANAAAAAAGVNALKVAEFNFVKENYTYDYEPVIGTFGEWEGTATVGGQPGEPNYLDYEHWSGQTHAYYEQDKTGYNNSNGWTIQYTKTAKLPAGDYMLKVAARSSAGTTSLVSCSATENTVSLPSVGNTAKGIDLNGNAAFEGDNFAHDGLGFGWEWRYLPFTLTETTDVTMTFYAEASTRYQWMSIADATLLSKQEIQNIVEIAGTDEAAPEAQIATSVITDRKLLEGLNTVIFPFVTTDAELGATTVLAYTGTTVEADGLTFNFQKVAPVDGVVTLQANTPYAVFVAADQTENLTFGTKNINPGGGWYNECVTDDPNDQFDFRGTYGEVKKGNDSFITNKDYIAGKERFVKASGGNRLQAYRAYLQFVGEEEPANVAFNFGGFVVDGIEAVELLNNLSGNIYNLNGQKLQKAQKGINIVNGKKVLVK